MRTRRVDEGNPGGQDLRGRLGHGKTRAQADKVESTVGAVGELVTGRNESSGVQEADIDEDDARYAPCFVRQSWRDTVEGRDPQAD